MVETILGLIQKGQWLPLAVLVLTLVNAWLSDTSKVPINLPPAWRAVAVIVLGQGLGVLTAYVAHQSWHSLAVHAALASVIAISTSHAVFSDGAPNWLKTIAGIAQSLEEAQKPRSPEAKKPQSELGVSETKEESKS